MPIVTVPKSLLNPISLPGMGRSIELNGLTQEEAVELRNAFSLGELEVEFAEEPDVLHKVTNIWPDPHDFARMTLFIK